MVDQVVIKTEQVQGWTVLPTTDRSQTAIVFKARTGTAAFTLLPDDFDRFAGKIISDAAKLVEGRAAATAQNTDGNPIRVNLLSIDAHPNDRSSALLAVEVGKLQLLFEADANTLLRSCRQFLDQRRTLRDSSHVATPA